MRPWEFWNLTPAEFAATVEGHRKREERNRYLIAWQTAYLLSPWSKKKVTPEKLLGIDKRKRLAGAMRPTPPQTETE